MADSFDSFDDIIQMEDITDRIDELRGERDGLQEAITDAEEALETAETETPDAAELLVALSQSIGHARDALSDWDSADELKTLGDLADELQGMGGDHQWNGAWYPGYLIRDSHFKDYAMELADDIGAIYRNASWPLTCIDWDQAARELQMDYSSVEIDGITYWCR